MNGHHLVGVAHVAVGQLGEVYQAIFLDADVHKGAEVGDVAHDAGQLHTFAQVVQGADVRVKLEHLDGAARVASGLVQLLEDVFECGHADGVCQVAFRADAQTQLLVGYQLADGAVQILGHLLHDAVAFGVDGRIVQRVLGVGDAQEAGALFKGLSAHAWHFQQVEA